MTERLVSYAEFYPWNRAHHCFTEVFNGLYETSVPEYCTGILVLFDCYAFKFQVHAATSICLKNKDPALLVVGFSPLIFSTNMPEIAVNSDMHRLG